MTRYPREGNPMSEPRDDAPHDYLSEAASIGDDREKLVRFIQGAVIREDAEITVRFRGIDAETVVRPDQGDPPTFTFSGQSARQALMIAWDGCDDAAESIAYASIPDETLPAAGDAATLHRRSERERSTSRDVQSPGSNRR